MLDINIVIGTKYTQDNDPVLFFGSSIPIDYDEVIEFKCLPEDTTYIDILVKYKVFPSRSQANKNWPIVAKKMGIENEVVNIPFGFSTFVVGKGGNMKVFTILKAGRDRPSFI